MVMPLMAGDMPATVIVSERAHAAIVAETFEQHPNETGGILLGHCVDGIWHVLEAIDPGPEASFSAVTFAYDTAYVNHLSRKVAGQYQQPLKLIGLWHRHPGSLDRFSSDDDITNRRYANQSPDGAISCLVNLDPHFRITAYHVSPDLRYRRLQLSCSDGAIPAALREWRRTSCLHPEALEIRRQGRELDRLLTTPLESRLAGPLAPAVSALAHPLLELLNGQRRFAYGLQLQGSRLLMALVEKGGAALHRLQLLEGDGGGVRIQSHGDQQSWPWDEQRFVRFLQGGGHG